MDVVRTSGHEGASQRVSTFNIVACGVGSSTIHNEVVSQDQRTTPFLEPFHSSTHGGSEVLLLDR